MKVGSSVMADGPGADSEPAIISTLMGGYTDDLSAAVAAKIGPFALQDSVHPTYASGRRPSVALVTTVSVSVKSAVT